jgi:hypothetical protein
MICLIAINATAQSGIGPRLGLSADPGQYLFGAQYESRSLYKELTFRPNFVMGRSIDDGDDTTHFAANFEFAYKIPAFESAAVYIGAGPALIAYKYDSTNHLRGGVNFLVGIEHDKGWFEEIKVGGKGSPRVQFTVGYTFRFHKK